MSFSNFFQTNRSRYQRLFNKTLENRQHIDEIIVHPNQCNHDPTTSQNPNHDNFQKIEDLIDFFQTSCYKSLTKDTNNVLLLKFETSSKPNAADLVKLSQSCLENSIVILLTLDERKQFFIYWKSKQIKHFLTLKVHDRADFMNDIQLFEFLADFLTNSLKRGHLGLQSKVPIKPTLNTVEFDLLADHRNYNLLLVAAEIGNAHVVKLMLTLGFSSELRGINAQTLAWKNRHFEVLSILLKSNLIYPYSICIDECPDDIQKFFEVSRELNEAILVKDRTKILRIISQNTDMTHFYNLTNESALAFALKNKHFDMYQVLISSENLNFGPHERFSELKEDMKENEREKLREIHFEESKYLPDNHMHILMSNSRIGHDTSDAKMKFKCIQNAFEILNGNIFVQIILRIVAASRNFRIVFDFNRDSVEVVDPTVDGSTDGLFYLSGRIYIAAKKLLDSKLKYEALGVLAHELCHYSMILVYKNSAKPYFSNDSKTKKTFEEILNFCIENTGKEKIVDLVHKCYDASAHHAEIIVRVPQLIIIYLNNPEKFNTLKVIFHKLFDIYEDKIFTDMKKALPRIEASAESEKKKNKKKVKRLKMISIGAMVLAILGILGIFVTQMILYKPNYIFSLLSREDQILVENAPVVYNHVDVRFHDLFPRNSSAYNLLSSDDISQMLDGISLNISSPHFMNLNNLIIFKWTNLTTELKKKFLASNFTFQNEPITFNMMNLTNPDVYNSLESKQIIQVLEGKPFFVHKMIKNETAFYTERTMFTEYIYAIYYLYMIELNQNKTSVDCIYKNTTGTSSDTFENFYNDFEKQNFAFIMSETNRVMYLDYFLRCKPSDFRIFNPKFGNITDTLLDHNTLQKGFDDILKESDVKHENNSSRLFILSADAGTGKTETFRQFALRIKRLYPTRWVSYIDYRQNKKKISTIHSISDVKKALVSLLELDAEKNKFEENLFEEFFMTGRMILLWDGFDQISPNWLESSNAMNMLILIQSNTKNIQFVSTRPSYSDRLRRAFRIEPYTFIPLDEDSKNNFLQGYFTSQNVNKSQIQTYINKVQRIADATQSRDDFNTPLLLGMISNVISKFNDIYLSENLYQIYKKFVEIKLGIWLKSVNNGKELIEDLMMQGISVPEFHQRFALRMIPDNNFREFSRFSSLRLKITAKNFPNRMKLDQISDMGILNYNSQKSYSFAHSTFVEFFIAQYIISNVFKTEDEPSVEEAEIRIRTFYWSIQNIGVTIFINSYFDSVASNNLRDVDPQISNLFDTKYSNFLIKMLQSRSVPIPTLIKFFKRDHNLLTNQLQLNDSNGIYPSTFNYASFNYLSYDAINRSAINESVVKDLTKDEYEKFISLKDHNGIILYSMYCVKQYRNSSEYARQSFPGYDLPDEIFDSYNVSKVLSSIAKNLTSNELKELLTSETVWTMLNIFNNTNRRIIYFRYNQLEFYETLWNLVEKHLSVNEQKNWISKILKFVFLLEDKETRQFLLFKVNQLLSDAEIYETFSTLNILHYTVTIGNAFTYFGRFDYSWNYFESHTTKEQQKMILKRSVEIECYLNQMDQNLCYLVPKINLLQASLLENMGSYQNNNASLLSFQNMVKIYRKYFNNDTELQELIVQGSQEFIPFLIILRSKSDCTAYADFLKDLFKGNESLRNFLLKPVRPSKLNIFDFFFDLFDYRVNFVIFRRLLKR